MQELETLGEEHSRLKRMYADLAMDNQLLSDLFSKKRLAPATKRQITVNHSWSMDYINDSIMGVRKFRTFNVIHVSTLEALAIEVDISTVPQTLDKNPGERYRMAWQASGHQNGQRP